MRKRGADSGSYLRLGDGFVLRRGKQQHDFALQPLTGARIGGKREADDLLEALGEFARDDQFAASACLAEDAERSRQAVGALEEDQRSRNRMERRKPRSCSRLFRGQEAGEPVLDRKSVV